MLRWLEPGGGLVQRYRLVDALLETGVEFSYAWKDVNVIPRADAATRALVVAVTPLLDARASPRCSTCAPAGTTSSSSRSRPSSSSRPTGPATCSRYRLWRLQRAALLTRFERLGVAVARWTTESRSTRPSRR